MRILSTVIFLALAAAGCGNGNTDQQPDMTVPGNVPDCPGNVDVDPANQVSCATVGDQCLNHGMSTLVCHCLCNHKWECDEVRLVCDPDGGTPGD